MATNFYTKNSTKQLHFSSNLCGDSFVFHFIKSCNIIFQFGLAGVPMWLYPATTNDIALNDKRLRWHVNETQSDWYWQLHDGRLNWIKIQIANARRRRHRQQRRRRRRRRQSNKNGMKSTSICWSFSCVDVRRQTTSNGVVNHFECRTVILHRAVDIWFIYSLSTHTHTPVRTRDKATVKRGEGGFQYCRV